MKEFISDFKKLVKLRLTLTVVFSASISFLIGAKQLGGDILWINWLLLTLGGFLVTGAANGFNEIIEKDLDKLMTRTADRPLPSGRMTTGQALILSLFMGILGTLVLVRLNFVAGLLSVFSILLYAFVYTPLKRKSPIAVFVGAFPGALPPLIGYFAAFSQDDLAIYSQTNESAIIMIPFILFGIQFLWQFPHFWSLAWVIDDDYKQAGFRLLPTTKRDKISAFMVFLSALIMIPAAFLPMYYGFGGWIFTAVSAIGGVFFAYYGFQLFKNQDIASARKVMFTSFFYLPITQLVLLFDFIPLK
ncbi:MULTISPECIES: heme o synthase [Sphingobacterium]|jgi:protoheme IX farnesyltransferase|uniref:heme o synthase n=1 Tax=Sphingobacterium TaxID=28453 RepID=UPI00038A5068|nr:MULTISPECIES: heme o synthase [Sphingobacterium]KKX47592.1 polyprenyltransferase [Sphingobacterium sp. IITKGP-BTPF85]MBB2952850.1 protoheme IX farnesyltransferase [Sphingobacterium sp. JUb56]MCW2261313.1 protoheme IX farnesyltransferase [Sphingobacterium kitahiroshimense]NJI76101.1 protoheme IX farnesyltransferase [Sphingobacterium sp. B16(2022)]QQD14611.1 protoheme IX farnesyltransferase [Sphingobacterium sp. UDSM-2020]